MDTATRRNKNLGLLEAYVVPLFTALNTCQTLVKFNYEYFPLLPTDGLHITDISATALDPYYNNDTIQN